MRVTVPFTHTEILYPSLPGLEIEVKYQGSATIVKVGETEFSCEIQTLKAWVNGGPLEDVSIPSAETTDGNRFLSPLREAARKEAAKLEKQIQPVPEPREYRYTHAQNFPSFRPISPDNDDRFYG